MKKKIVVAIVIFCCLWIIFWGIKNDVSAAPVTPVETSTVETVVQEETVPEDPDENTKIEEAMESTMHKLDDCTLTAYCPCEWCCGQWSGGPTYSGVMPEEGRTVAVDPDVIPIGSWVVIDGNWYVTEDTGAFSGRIIDIYFADHNRANDFGLRTNVTVYWEEN